MRQRLREGQTASRLLGLSRLPIPPAPQADILMVTDGEIPLPSDKIMKQLAQAQDDLGLQVSNARRAVRTDCVARILGFVDRVMVQLWPFTYMPVLSRFPSLSGLMRIACMVAGAWPAGQQEHQPPNAAAVQPPARLQIVERSGGSTAHLIVLRVICEAWPCFAVEVCVNWCTMRSHCLAFHRLESTLNIDAPDPSAWASLDCSPNLYYNTFCRLAVFFSQQRW